jgi:hypothetical protein
VRAASPWQMRQGSLRHEPPRRRQAPRSPQRLSVEVDGQCSSRWPVWARTVAVVQVGDVVAVLHGFVATSLAVIVVRAGALQMSQLALVPMPVVLVVDVTLWT